MERIYIGMGSNLADPAEQLRSAVEALAQLPHSTLAGVSAFYQSDSLLPGQPRYTNAVAALDCTLEPLQLLDALQAIENGQGRKRLERWGPRTLDLDILLFGDRLIDQPRLKVPHYQMQERAFVLYPLAELAPADLRLADGRCLKDLLLACPFVGLERLPQIDKDPCGSGLARDGGPSVNIDVEFEVAIAGKPAPTMVYVAPPICSNKNLLNRISYPGNTPAVTTR